MVSRIDRYYRINFHATNVIKKDTFSFSSLIRITVTKAKLALFTHVSIYDVFW